MSDHEPLIEPVGEMRRITQALNQASIPYALCGGLALGVHGYIRATRDVDLLILTSDLEAVKQIAINQGYLDAAGDVSFRDQKRRLHRLTKIIPDPYADPMILDLLLISDPTDDVWVGREVVQWDGSPLSVVSREGLLAMKREAGRDQDLLDIKRLEG